jgi:[ribosomal protein S18]-alanine N-acetyltransferase
MKHKCDEIVTIRFAEPMDYPHLYKIECIASSFPWSQDAIKMELLNANGLNFVSQVKDGNTIYGFVFSVIVADELCIHNLATLPEFQRRGIAQHLLETTITNAQDLGALHAYLEVRSKNIPAIALYKKLGFLVQTVRKKYYCGDSDDALVMHKRVSTQIQDIQYDGPR